MIDRSKYHHDVTPAILSRDAVLMLQEHLYHTSRKSRIPFGMRNLLCGGLSVLLKYTSKLPFAIWRLYLLRSDPWNEYPLYYSFLEAHGLFEKYHFSLDNRLSGNSFWNIDEYDSWEPADSFSGKRTFFFSVLQSNTKLDPEIIWQRVFPYLQPHLLEE